MVDFYRRFISRASDTLATVSDLLINNIKGNTLIQWTPDAIKAFQHCKEQLAAATLLAHPKDDAPLSLDHHSPSLSSQGNYQQRRRSTAHTTLLAIYLAVKHFRHMIEGRVFTIYTDHKPLTFAFLQKPEKCSPRQFRHLDFIPSFSTDIQYVPGSQNVVADALSRVDAIHATLDYKSLATSQQTDEELKVPLQGKAPTPAFISNSSRCPSRMSASTVTSPHPRRDLSSHGPSDGQPSTRSTNCPTQASTPW
ncbi:hypothetical protein M8J77_010377 [Diaphorina citri]|nr:hypothetical protein M8J77_010377 [Diaphorina citri]